MASKHFKGTNFSFLTSLKTFYFFTVVGKQTNFFQKYPRPLNIKWSIPKHRQTSSIFGKATFGHTGEPL